MEVSMDEPTDDAERREVGDEAVWSLSTAKPGNGVDQLRDNNLDTYWQSDGPQPHLLNIQFFKKTSVKEIVMYLDHKLDESYTPHKISIRAGSTTQDLREIMVQTIVEPTGWVTIPLTSPDDAESPLRAFLLQIAIVGMHQNGRDTHIRQVKIFSPRDSYHWSTLEPSTVEVSAYMRIR